MKKLLFVMHSLCSGGAEKSLVNLLNELPEDQYEIDLLLFKQEGMFLPQVPEWVTIIDTPEEIRLLYNPVRKSGKMMYTKVAGTVLSGFQEKDICKSKAYRWKHFYRGKINALGKKYDVAVAYISGEALYFVGDKVHADRKYVWIHNDYLSAGHPKEYDFPYLNRMDGIISVSDTCVRILKAVFPEFRHKIYLIENITSSSAVRKRADEFVPSEFNSCENPIVSIGRLDLQKGFDLAIQAAELLKKRGISFRWMVLGSGSLKKQLQRQIDQAGLNDVFFLLGAKENPYPYLKYCTLFVQPSRFEGKSVVLDEAKILGTPILAAAYPTVNDQIEHGKEGYIAGTSPESLADGIENLLLHREQREKLSGYLLSREYGNQQEVKKYITLFDGLMKGEARRHGVSRGESRKKPRIGLLTIHDTLNYGSLLQAFALYKAMEESGCQVEVIDYKCVEIRKRESTCELKDDRSLKGVIRHVLWHRSLKRKRDSFWDFMEFHMNISREYHKETIEAANEAYDTFVVGSDIVWGAGITGGDLTYFLDFAGPEKKKVAFSSSAGSMWEKKDWKKISALLRRFDHIAVRERLASDWIREIAGLDAAVTCDPTMLWDAAFWDKWADEACVPKQKYVLIYLTTADGKTVKDGIAYAREHQLKACYINFFKPVGGAKSLKPARAEEWLALIKNAEIIFTASYHGLLFSLYFHKPVYFYNRGEKSRMICLAEELGIEAREGHKENLIKNFPVDFALVEKKIKEKREYSWNMLTEYLAD